MEAPARDPLSPDTSNAWPPQRHRTWFGIAGAPAAWFVQFGAGWYISGNACLLNTPSWGGLGPGQVWALEALVAVLCLGTAAAALWIALLDWRASANTRISEIHATGRPDYLAAVALLVSSAFLLAVLYNGLAQLMLPLCEAIR